MAMSMTYYTNTHKCFVIIISVLAISLSFKENAAVRIKTRRSNYDYYVRCTRRFTPGLCIEPVRPVWTFVFQLQNCTERYGCPPDWRTNRFVSFGRCTRRCKPLVEFYTEILSRDPRNLSAYLRSRTWDNSRRRQFTDEYDITDIDKDYDTPKKQIHIKGPQPNILDENVDHNYWAVTADIDDVEAEDIANDDLFDHD